MSEQIKKSDIFQEDPFKEVNITIDKGVSLINQYDNALKALASTLSNEVNKTNSVSIKDLEKIIAIEKEASKLINKKKTSQQNLNKLEKERLKLQEQLEVAIAKKNLATSKSNIELQKTRIETNKINKATRDSIKAKQDETNAYKRLSNASRDYKNEAKRLAAELLDLGKRTRENSKDWDKLEKEYNQVASQAIHTDKALKKIDKTLGDNQRNVGNYTDATRGFSNALSQLGIVVSAGIITDKVFTTFADFDENIANIQKTTGLLKDEARELSLSLFDIDTRTSINELQGLASAAGRLGIEGTENILGFVNSADKIFVALGDDLDGTAEEIATGLGKIADQFGLIEQFGIEGGIERVGSVINELAANSKASAGAIFDFTNRLAGVASQAGITQPEIAALGTLFDDAGQSMEVAATVISQLLPILSANQEKFAKTAGLTAEEFSNLLANNPIGALKAVAQGAQSSEKGLDGLNETLESFGVESTRAAGIVGVLANNTEQLTEFQNLANKALEENTSITDENDIKQQTLNAQVEKLTNSLDKYIIGIDSATGVTGGLGSTIGFIARNLGTILNILGKALIAFAVYKTTLIAINIQQKIANTGLANMVKGFFNLKQNADNAGKSVKGVGGALKGIGWTALIGVAIELATAFYDIASGAKEARRQAEELDNYRAEASKEAEEFISNRNKGLNDELDILRRKMEIESSAAKTEAERNKVNTEYLQQRKKLIESNSISIETQIGITERELSSFEDKLNRINEIEKQRVNSSDYSEQTSLLLERTQLSADLGATLGITNTAWFGLLESGAEFSQVQSRLKAEIAATKDELGIYNDELKQSNNNLLDASTNLTVDSNERENNDDKIKAQVKGLKSLNKEREKEKFNMDELNKGKTLDEIEDDEISQLNDREDKFRTERLTKIADAERLETITEKEAQDQRLIAEVDYLLSKKEVLEQYGRDTREIDLSIAEARLNVAKSVNDEILEKENKTLEEQKKNQEEWVKTVNETQKALVEIYNSSIESRIEALKKEEDAATEQLAKFQTLAEDGAILDEQSIADEERRRREAIKEQERLRKQQERAQFIQIALQNVSNGLANGQNVAESLGTTVALQAGLKALFAGFDGFYKGTNNAPEGFAWTDEKGSEIHTDKQGNIKDLGSDGGARLKWLDKGDKIFTHGESMNMLNTSLPSPTTKEKVIVSHTDDLLREQNRLLKNAVESKLTAEQVGSIIHLTTEDKRGNHSRINLYKYKK